MTHQEPTDEEVETFRSKARECARLHKSFLALCTPKDFEARGQEIFGGAHHAEKVLAEFAISSEEYDVIWPDEDKCPVWGRAIAKEEFGHDIGGSLEAFIAIPKRLACVDIPTRLRAAIRLPGGGGVRCPIHRTTLILD
jgi:hypothetical protein